jgi:ubiquitin C-terminal hydrolase
MNIPITNYEKNGFTGLANLGNTCFLNSCLQALSHTYELHKIAVQPKLGNNPDTRIFNEWKVLVELMWSGNGVVKPIRFVSAVHEIAKQKDVEIFTGFTQNDVSEFLRFILNCFHSAIARPVKVNISGKPQTNLDNLAVSCYQMLSTTYSKEYSEIQNLFYGICVSQIKSMQSSLVYSQKPEQFFMVDLPIPTQLRTIGDGTITLANCFNLHMMPEQLTGDNMWFNEKTGQKEVVEKSILFWSLPNILIITLKRFDARGGRINDNILFPLESLDLTKYVEGYRANKYVYNLYAVCNHIGGQMGGHYTAYVKNDKANKWILYDDERVSIVENPASIITPQAYCLFYRIVS